MAYFIYFAIWFGSVAYNLYMFIFGPLVVSDPDVYFNNALLSLVIGFVGAFPFIWIIQKIEESKAKKEAQEKEGLTSDLMRTHPPAAVISARTGGSWR